MTIPLTFEGFCQKLAELEAAIELAERKQKEEEEAELARKTVLKTELVQAGDMSIYQP